MRETGKFTTKVDLNGKRVSVYLSGKLICDIYTYRETGMDYVYLYATQNEMRVGVSGEKEVRYTFTTAKKIKPTKL